MQIASGKDGIQRLLQAEKEAQTIVANARKGPCPTPKYRFRYARLTGKRTRTKDQTACSSH